MKKRLLSAGAALAVVLSATPAQAQIDQELGDVILVGFDFCPHNFAEANGALMSINEYPALFALLGTQYGGDGRTSFALPDLRGRIPVHVGTGEGLSTIIPGQRTGAEQVTLGVSNLPPHSHALKATDQGNNETDPQNSSFSILTGNNQRAYTSSPNTAMTEGIIGTTGGRWNNEGYDAAPVAVSSPTLPMLYCVAITGTYPSRN